MKAPNVIPVIVVTCVLIVALCWFTVTLLTTPGRAIASAIVLSGCAAAFIWFARTNRISIARGIISVGATALAAPLAAQQALMNETIFSFFESHGPTTEQILEWDRLFALGWTLTGIGAAIFVVSLIVGLVMHRTPKL